MFSNTQALPVSPPSKRILNPPQSRRTPASIRIRDNQRRSRAQRKEFVDSLQQRVQEYERRGIAATVEVQQAAQAVARENARLRGLLARLGVGKEEIDREVHFADNDLVPADGSNTSSFDTALKRQLLQEESTPTTAPVPVRCNSCNEAQNSYEAAECHKELPEPREPVILPLPPPPIAVSKVRSVAETSCDTAATILAQMRGDGDSEFARTMLGCQGTADCSVKNTTLFQVLDEV
jgi:hypothetical protein